MTTVLRALATLLVLVSPWVLYWTLTQKNIALAGILLVAFIILRTIPAWLAAPPAQRRATLVLPAIGLLFALLGTLFQSGTMFLLLPSANHFGFAWAFFSSLRTTPLIEHFARLSKPNLPPDEVIYCRSLTKVWGSYMVVLGIIGLLLAFAAPPKIWLAFAGVGGYLMVGLLFAVEYVVRKARFRDYGKNPLDWAIRQVFPPRS